MSHPRLSITPAGAIFDRSLEPRDQQVLNLLGCYTDKAGWCRRSQVRMAKQLKCGRSSIQRSLDRLVEAGWVEKKRPPWSNPDGQPSNSYMYRVILDRDDFVIEDNDDDEPEQEAVAAESHAEDAEQGDQCPPVGTPPAQPDGHPGAQPSVGTGAHTYVGTKNDPLERPLLERERDARARDRTVRFLAAFEQRWPTAAADDRQRVAYAAEALSEDEQQAALAGIGPFLDNLQRLKRKHAPAGWRYLEEKRWTLLLEQPNSPIIAASHPRGSAEAEAIVILHDLVGRESAIRAIYLRADGSISTPSGWAMTPQLLKLAEAPPQTEWVALSAGGAASWERLFCGLFRPEISRRRLREGSRAPWAFAPGPTGKLYPATGPPETLATQDDLANWK